MIKIERIRMRGDKKQGKIKRTEQEEEEKAGGEDKKEGMEKDKKRWRRINGNERISKLSFITVASLSSSR